MREALDLSFEYEVSGGFSFVDLLPFRTGTKAVDNARALLNCLHLEVAQAFLCKIEFAPNIPNKEKISFLKERVF